MMQVHLDEVVCDEFLGVNAVYHGFAYMPFQEERGMHDADRQREFALVSDIGLRLARTWYRPDWACGDDLQRPFNWESPEMLAFYRWLEAMQERNIKVALQAGWWCSRDTCLGHETPDPDRDLPRFAEWVSESLRAIIVARGFRNVTHLVLMTEPVNYPSGPLPEGISQQAYYGMTIRAIHRRLVADGRRHLVRTVGPNSGSTSTGAWVDWAAAGYDECIDVYSWHSYNGHDFDTNPPLEYRGWLNLVEQGTRKLAGNPKPVWFDEYGANRPDETVRVTADYGCYLAQAVAAFINGGCQTSLLWILLDQKYPGSTTNNDSFYNGVHRWGLAPWPYDDVPDPLSPRPAWYAFGLMSRLLGGGPGYRSLRTVCDGDVFIAAVAQPGGAYAFLVVNAAHEARDITVALSRPLNLSLARHLYDPATIQPSAEAPLPPCDRRLQVTNQWTDRLPARAVAVYAAEIQ